MKGMSPRKSMASGMKEAATSGGSFGVKSFESMHGAPSHPDKHMGHEPMEDHERAISHPVHHSKGHLPAQAAPHHGPHHVDGYMSHHSKPNHHQMPHGEEMVGHHKGKHHKG